jgi:tRNA pseudouridine synthase 10
LKFSRDLSQSPWIIAGKRKTENSVEELILYPDIHSHFSPESHFFISAGREDSDVRMLGSGRPFVIELVNPRNIFIKLPKLREIEMKINEGKGKDLIFVRDLQMVTKDDVTKLKEGGEIPSIEFFNI